MPSCGVEAAGRALRERINTSRRFTLKQRIHVILPFSFPAELLFWDCGVRKRQRTWRGKDPPPNSDPFSDAQLGKNLAHLSRKFVAIPNRRLKFHKALNLSSSSIGILENSRLTRGQVWRVCVLEFVLERSAFYSPFVTRDDFVPKTRFPFVKRVCFETKRDVLKSTISES
jgi:hypothetical protein